MTNETNGGGDATAQGADWRRSTFCGANGCVEVALQGDAVAVRDSAEPARVLRVGREDWAAFVAGVKDGQFDLGH